MEDHEELRSAIRSCAESAGNKSAPTETRLEAALAANHLAAALKTLKEAELLR